MKKVGALLLMLFILPVYSLADYLPDTALVPDGAGVRINDTGLNELSNFLRGYITPEMVYQILAGMNPIIDEHNFLFDMVVNATGVTFNQPITIALDSQIGNRLTFDGTINNLRLYFNYWGEMWPFPAVETDGYIQINVISIAADVTANVAYGNIDIILNLDPATDITLTGMSIHTGTPIVDELFSILLNLLSGIIKTVLGSIIQNNLAVEIENLLNELPLEMTFEILGVNLTFSMLPADIRMDAVGLSLWLAGNVITDTTSDCVPPQPGSYFTPSDRPSYGATIPYSDPPVPYQVALCLNDDILNRALYTVYKSGLLCFFLDPEAMEEFGLPFPITSGLFAAAVPRLNDIAVNAPMTLVLQPNEPPIVTFNNNADPYLIDLSLHDLDVLVYIYAWDRWLHLFTLRVDVDDAGVNVTVTEDAMIHLEISEDLSVTNEVVWDELLNLTAEERANVESILPTIIAMILPTLMDVIPDIPLPSFEQFGFSILDIVVHGNRNFIGVFGDLSFTEGVSYSPAFPTLEQPQTSPELFLAR